MGADVGDDVSSGKQEWFVVLSHRFVYHGGFGPKGRDKLWGRHTSRSTVGIPLFIGTYRSVTGAPSILTRAIRSAGSDPIVDGTIS